MNSSRKTVIIVMGESTRFAYPAHGPTDHDPEGAVPYSDYNVVAVYDAADYSFGQLRKKHPGCKLQRRTVRL